MTFKLLIGAALVLAAYLSIQAVAILSPGDSGSHVQWACEAIGVVGGVWLLISWSWRRERAGVVLDHVTDHKTRAVAIIVLIGTGMLLVGWLMEGSPLDPLESLTVPLSIVSALVAIQELRSGTVLTERGVLRFHGLKPHNRPAASRVEQAGGIAVIVMFCVVVVAHAWMAPGGVRVAGGTVVQFISDDEYGQPKIAFVRVPGDGLRAVMENRGGDGTIAHIGAVDLGPVQAGDELHVRWGPNGSHTDAENSFHVALVYNGQIHIYTMPRPFPESPVILPTVHHPIDEDGAIVVAYSLAEHATGRFDDLSGMEVPHRLTVKFERSR